MKYLNNNPNYINHFLSDNKRTTKIVLIKNINNNENKNISNNIKLQGTQVKNHFNFFRNSKMNRGLSDYNLKIDTNYLDLIPFQSKLAKNSDNKKYKHKGLNKTTSYDTMNMGNNLKIKNTELDNKLSKWILKNLKQRNPINLKINNQFSMNNNNSNTKFVLNLNNFNNNKNYNYLKKASKTNSMINILSDNGLKKDQREYSLKNKQNPNPHFPNINNISNNLNKKSFELNTMNINTNLVGSLHNNKKRSFNTINSANTNSDMNKVKSLKNIHNSNINNHNPNILKSNEKNPPISFNLFNSNNKNNKTRNKSKNNNLFNRNMNLNFGTSGKMGNRNYKFNNKIKSFN
jgi:hypothetical protein